MTGSGAPDEHRLERLGLVVAVLACVGSLTWISLNALRSTSLDPNAATLNGAIVAGLVATAAACVQALRGYAATAQLSKVTDQLAASTPNAPAPKDATEAANRVADAAADTAEQIGERG